MKKSIKEFKDIHKSADIWIIGAGASMDFIDPSFFEGKITIGLNRVSMKYDCSYIVSKDSIGFSKVDTKNAKLIISKHNCGDTWQRENSLHGDYWIFEHPDKPNQEPLLHTIQKNSDKIIVSYSTITSAMHIAAYMGAKNIILCGHDCGLVNNNYTFKGYYENSKEVTALNTTSSQDFKSEYFKFIERMAPHTIQVKEKLLEVYNTNIYSLNPFTSFQMEGNEVLIPKLP